MKKLIEVLRPRWREFKLSFYLLNRNILTRIALITVVLLVLLAIFSPFIIPYPGQVENENAPGIALQAPDKEHLFRWAETFSPVSSTAPAFPCALRWWLLLWRLCLAQPWEPSLARQAALWTS